MSIKALSGLGLLTGAALLAAIGAAPAQAQAPGGSYLQTCTDVRMHGDHLIANCRRMDGSWARTAIDADRCSGPIANMNGNLTCNQGRGQNYGWSREFDHGRRDFEGYGSSFDRRDYRPGWDYGR